MRKKFIAACTPTLGSVSIEWASTLRAMAWPLNTGYVNFFTLDVQGGEIAETRNRCVQLALDYDTPACEVSHIFWLDDDVIASRMALLQLLSHNRDIASGVYFTRCDPAEPLIFPGRGAGTTPFVPDQAFETWGHGMGLTLIRTDVYRRMAAETDLGRDRYGRPAWYRTTGAETATFEDGVLWMGGTEDLYFLDAAGKLGYKPIIDTSRFAFGWHYDAAQRQGYPKKQWKQRMGGQPIVWDTPNGPVTWGG
jgi:hypothetical protein